MLVQFPVVPFQVANVWARRTPGTRVASTAANSGVERMVTPPLEERAKVVRYIDPYPAVRQTWRGDAKNELLRRVKVSGCQRWWKIFWNCRSLGGQCCQVFPLAGDCTVTEGASTDRPAPDSGSALHTRPSLLLRLPD